MSDEVKTIYVLLKLEGILGKGLLNYIGQPLSGFVNGVGYKTTKILDIWKEGDDWYVKTVNNTYLVKED